MERFIRLMLWIWVIAVGVYILLPVLLPVLLILVLWLLFQG